MLKSFITGVYILLAATFGLFHVGEIATGAERIAEALVQQFGVALSGPAANTAAAAAPSTASVPAATRTITIPPPPSASSAQPAAAAEAAQQYPAAGEVSTTPQLSHLSSAPTQTPSTRDTASVLNEGSSAQYTISNTAFSPDFATYATQADLTAATAALDAKFQSEIAALQNAPVASGPSAPITTAAFAPSQAIDQLNGTTLSNITVHSVAGLAASDIPALAYLPSTGGTVSGNLTVTGSFAGNLAVATSTSSASLTTSASSTIIGPELITNGSFTGSATGWTLGSNVTYGSNAVTTSCSSCNDMSISQSVTTTAGHTYLIQFDVSGVAGSGAPYVRFSSDPFNSVLSLTGHTSIVFTAQTTGAQTFIIDDWNYLPGDAYTLKNVSMKEITYTPALRAYAQDGSSLLNLEDDTYGNFFAGLHALSSNTSGTQNVAVGPSALLSNTTGFGNAGFGNAALLSNTTGAYNTALGNSALFSNTTGYQNTAIGDTALIFNTTGTNNTAEGGNALFYNTTGSFNTGMGESALFQNTSATDAVAIGFEAGFGYAQYHNQGSTYLGYESGYSAGNNSDYNTFLGYQSGYNDTTGSNNLILGTATSSTGIANLTTGSQNILIGNNISLPSATANGQLDIGNIIYGTGITGTGSTISSGNVGIGTTTPAYKLTVDNAGSSGVVAGFENSSGECTINPTSSSVNCSSDITLKKNINSISATSALASVLLLNPVFFNWNAETTGTPQHSGFIAQQVQPIFPDLVSQADNGTLLLNYAGLTPYLTGAIQEITSISGDFQTNLIAWLGNTNNGIENLFAKNIYATNTTSDLITATKELCVGSTCVTPTQFQAMVAAAGQTGSATGQAVGTGGPQAPPAGATATDTPPIIQINGENPATINVGDTYNDLGATITGPQADLNLGLTTYLNGTLTDPLIIDTSQPATDTIDYVATDGAGNTSTSTRTVLIQAASSAATSAAAEATTTTATTTP
jgi:hypothetical protein